MIPDLVNFRALLERDSLEHWLPRVRACAERAGLPAFATFHSPTSGPPRPLADFDPAALAEQQVRFEARDRTFLSVSAHPRLAGVLVQASWPLDGQEARCREAQRALAELLRELFATGRLEEGHVERVGADVDALPLTPVGQGFVALVTTDAAVSAAYQAPAVFWDAWDVHEPSGGRHLLVRGTQAATSADWFRAVFEQEWAMARAARPGQTRIGTRHAPPGCEALLMAGRSCLREIGTRNGQVELAGFVPQGAHVPAWEILTWRELLLRGRRDDGSPVSSLRVVFRDERMARAEATPLLDIGAQVLFLGRDGQYHPLS